MLITLVLAKASFVHAGKLCRRLMNVLSAACEVLSATQNMRRAAQRRYPFLET